MSEEELQAIRERCEAATPGTWVAYDAGRGHYGVVAVGTGTVLMTRGRKSAQADMELAAHARTDIAALLAEVERLRTREALLERLLDRVAPAECMAADEVGLIFCGVCGAEGTDVRKLDHPPHCDWVAARAALEQGK